MMKVHKSLVKESNVLRVGWRRAVPAGLVLVVASALAASAITTPGYRERHTTENDGSIWTAQANSRDPADPGSFLGRANTLAGVIDTAIAATARPQLLQDGPHVLIHDAATGSVASIDTNLGTASTPLVVPELKAPPGTIAAGAGTSPGDAGAPAVDLNKAGEVALGGDTVAVVDQAAGKLFVFAAHALPSGPLSTQYPAARVAAGSQVAVDLAGIVHVVAPSGAIADYSASGVLIHRTSLGADLSKASTPGSPFNLTTVGATVVAIDGAGGIYAEGHTGQLGTANPGPADAGSADSGAAGAMPVLQQPGPARPGVVFATGSALASMNLSTGAVSVLTTTGRGTPSAPVFVGERGCTYGAWSGTAAIPADAGTTGSPAVGPNVSVTCDDGRHYTGAGVANPQWRVNHGSAMLNDEISGNNLFFDGLTPLQIDDWSQAQRPSKGSQTTSSSATTVTTTVTQQPSSIDHPPQAVDDNFATRPGVPLIAHVLANDTDPDGDELAVTGLSDLPPAGTATIAIVDGGDAVQVTPAAQDSAPISFGYSIDDGRGMSSSARVTVAIHPLPQNAPPTVPVAEPPIVVAAGGRITVDLLRDVTDPDGDPVTLADARLPAGTGSLEFTGAGLAIISPSTAGSTTLTFSVTDGHGGVSSGSQLLDVRAPGTAIAPEVNDDHLQVVEGVPGTVDIFANDVSGSGQPLSLVTLDHPAGLSITRLGGGVLDVSASAVGTTLVHYSATDGTSQASGVLRVDAIQTTPDAVIAVRDDATLRPGQPTVIPVLANDIDRTGQVLVIDGVADVPPGLTVQQVDHAALSVSTQQPLTQPETLTYAVSDGAATGTGTVVVRPAPGGVDQPPVTAPLTVDVKAGNAIPIDVLAHDFDPEGESLTLASVAPLAAGEGTLFTEAGQLRYVAPAEPLGAVTATYVVKDSAGNATTGTVTIHVLPVSSVNHPPAPPQVIARTYTNRALTVTLPLLGIDPDGDVTTLVSVTNAPGALLGTIAAPLGADRFTFDAGATGGTQTLSYLVRDSGGLLGTGSIAIGIVAPPAVNSPPVALPDTVSIAPGMLRRVSVLANDSDPDGDPLRLDASALTQPALGKVAIDGSYLDVTAPTGVPDGRTLSFAYGIDDGRGGTAASSVTETVTAHAPLKPPVAVDDVGTAQRAGATVKLNVLANDTILNGSPAQATVAAPDGPAVTAAPGGVLTFVMPPHAASFSYTVTDAAGQSASAVVTVPLAVGLPPVASPDTATTKAGTPVSLNVLANDRDPQGAALTLVKIGSNAGGTAAINGSGMVRFTPAAGFSGLGGFSYVVSNGQQTAVGTATVTVTGGADHPPMVSALTVRLAPGQSRTLDLANAVSNVAGGDALTFSGLRGESDLVHGKLVNATLSVSVSPGASSGDVALRYTVADGHPRGTATGTLEVVITGAGNGANGNPAPGKSGKAGTPTAKPSPPAKPLPQALPDSASTLQAKAVTIDVLSNDVDPLGKGLHLVSVSGGGADGAGVVTGHHVTFTPSTGFHGVVALSYVMADASGNAARQATGAITVTVVGRPDAPGLPSGTARSHEVMLSWTVPNSNGGAISGYTVSRNGGVQACPANSCTITGLTNGQDYTFTVTATDEAGTGPASAASQPIHVDEAPDVPQAPTGTPGDKQISLTWPVPHTDGSAVSSYTVVQSPGGAKLTVTSPSATFTGLTNGSGYTYTVDATNKVGTSAYSASSAAVVPAGPPPTPSAPSATSTAGSGQATVTWGAASGNGSPIRSYTLEVLQGGSVTQTLNESDPSNRSASVAIANGQSYTFKISATNAVATSGYSGPSNTLTPSGVPDRVGTVTIDYFCCRMMGVHWTAPAANGSAITKWTIDDNQGDSFIDNTTSTDANEPIEFNKAYTFTVQACNAEGCGAFSAPSNEVTPDTGPSEPAVSDTTHMNSTTTWYVQYTWTTHSDGSPITSTDVSEVANRDDGTSKSANSTVTTTTYKSMTLLCNNTKSSYTDQISITVHNDNGVASGSSGVVNAPC